MRYERLISKHARNQEIPFVRGIYGIPFEGTYVYVSVSIK